MKNTPARGAFRPLRLTSVSIAEDDARVSLSPLDVARVTTAKPIDGRTLSIVVRRGDAPPLFVLGDVADVTLAWQRALRADDATCACEWPLPDDPLR